MPEIKVDTSICGAVLLKKANVMVLLLRNKQKALEKCTYVFRHVHLIQMVMYVFNATILL